ncbi:hypothetical protein GCK72_019424 [Caenorhabditis remanei]|uniref:Uncharacterized protein n=1 Tax=Caenorhabditis remanei TaxID=31234 RepID=A0A6A5GEJ9_CAERE|nr:hypothetical protein GCK72_019424 [Caenorhabditis remanei]KAF1752869.1 hypothetical protein GCK72_019424 [Caenorhabditis remanei]
MLANNDSGRASRIATDIEIIRIKFKVTKHKLEVAGIVPNSAHQNAEERARDSPRLPMLRKLQKLVELRGIKNFEDLLKAKEEVERDLKQRKRGINKENDSPTVETEKKTDESVAKKMKKEGNKKKKSIDETEPFPRLVRRNARRGSCVGDGQTWTEEGIQI